MIGYRIMANCMQVSVFLPKIQHFKYLGVEDGEWWGATKWWVKGRSELKIAK